MKATNPTRSTKKRKKLLWPFRVPKEQLAYWSTFYGCKDPTELEEYLRSKNRRLVVIDTEKKARRLAKLTKCLQWAIMVVYAPIYAVAVLVRWVLLFVLAVDAIFMLDWLRCKQMMYRLFHSNPFGSGF